MTVTTSRVGTVIANLVSLLQASPTFADPVRVYDGPVTTFDTVFTQAVCIGFDGDWFSPEFNAVDFNQSFNYLGNTSQFEEMDVHCVALGWSGDPTPSVVRNLALPMWAGVQTVFRTDPTIGIDGSTVTGLRAAGSLKYLPDLYGQAAAVIPFDLHVITTLLTV